MTQPRIVTTLRALAAALGVHERTASRWQKKGCPVLDDGTWDVDAVIAWHHGYKSGAADRTTNGAPAVGPVADLGTGKHPSLDPLKTARTTREELRIEREQIELEKLRGNVIERDQVAVLLATRMRLFRRRLRSIGRKLCRELTNVEDPREIQRRIDEEHDGVLWEAYGDDGGD